jgi:hypothetical protein
MGADMDLGIALAIAGLAVSFVGIPPFLQMSFGRPDFDLGVDDFVGPDGKSFFVTARNKTINNRLLKFIGVRRDIGDLDGAFSIRELGSDRVVAHLVSGALHNAVSRETALMVRAFPGRTIGMNVIHMTDGAASIIDARSENLQQIAAGNYIVDASFICGERIFRLSKNLRIGEEPHQTFWY